MLSVSEQSSAKSAKWPHYWLPFITNRMRRLRRELEEASRNVGPHWQWDTHKVASGIERYRAKHRRSFKQWCHLQQKTFGEYWDFDRSGDELWNEFAAETQKEQQCTK